MNEIENKLKECLGKVEVLWNSLDVDSKLINLNKYNEQINDPRFWDDTKRANEILKKVSDIKLEINDLVNLRTDINDRIELLELIDEDMIDEYNGFVNNLENIFSDIELKSLLNEEHDKKDCYLEIHAGAGGTESCDWANMLYRMYNRYCSDKNYKCEVVSMLDGEEVGVKSVTVLIKGFCAYGYLKNERGVHRLIRISPFDSAGKRHTSFASIEVVPVLDDDTVIKISDDEIKVDVYRSSGAGGQHVNTTDSAVRITHLPSGIVVTCQQERSQIKNKEKALKVLTNKLKLLEEEKQKDSVNALKDGQKEINFGSQIRTYTMNPYSLVKDHRTNFSNSDVNKVLDGQLDGFINSLLHNK